MLPGFGERLREQIVEAAAIGDRAILQQRAGARGVVLEELRIFLQRDAERGDRLFVFLVAEIGVAEIAVEHGHVVVDLDGFFVGLDGFAEFLALIPDRADVVLRVGVFRIGFERLFVIPHREGERFLLMERDAKLVEIHGVGRIFVGQAS